jgi:DNA-binding CsgD family transcriptional regulator
MSRTAASFVGRSAELAALDEALETARRGFAAVAVAGEPGLGKTRLLEMLEARADRHGCLVLTGRASELEADLPFGLFVDALDEYLYGLEPRRLAALDDATRAELGHVFPALATARSEREERYRLHRAVRALLEAVAGPKPLVLIFDDLHWADSGSLELLGSLLRRPPQAPLLIALGVRPRQVPERIAAAVERVAWIELAPFTNAEARELVGDVADELYARCGGNPFYLEQLARAPRVTASGPAVALAGVEVPRAVATALAGELAQLSADARVVLAGAAVVGDPFEPELAAAAAGLEHALDALDELLRADLVRPTEVPRRFRFRHPLVRSAVYAGAPGGWRLLAHERSAEALAARGASALERAHHVERSARHGDTAAIAVLRDAGAAAAGRAPASAARLFGSAARLLPARDPERAQLLAAQAQAHMAAGQWREAYAAIRECLELTDGPTVPMIATAAALENLLGHHQAAHRRLHAALPSEVSADAGLLMMEISRDGLYQMRYDEMGAWAGRALEVARALGDHGLAVRAAAAVALAGAFQGDVAAGLAGADEAAALVDAMPDEELARNLAFAGSALGAAELLLDRSARGGARAERVLAVAEATGQGHSLPVLFWAGSVRTWVGRLREAAELNETAIEIARVAGHEQGLMWNQFARAFTALAAGDNTTALSAAREAAAVMQTVERSFPATGAAHALAAALMAHDDPAGARDVLLETCGEGLERVPVCWRASAFELLTRIELGLGRPALAATAAGRAQACAEQLGLRPAAAMAARAAAHVAPPADAAVLALRSAAAFADCGAPVEAAGSRALAGGALAAAGEVERAAAELERAADEFERWDALGRRDACERELRRLGRRGRYRRTKAVGDGSPIASLTERELQIARLVVDRRTNAEIAAELYLSTKTVETHLRNIFHKLGVSSRVEVARAVERAT